MSPNLKCHQNQNVTKTQLSPKRKCHQKKNFIKLVYQKLKCHKNSNVTKRQLSLKRKCHQNKKCYKYANFTTGTNLCLHLSSTWDGTTKCPSLVHMDQNGLPCHGLSDSRVVSYVEPSSPGNDIINYANNILHTNIKDERNVTY